MSKQRVFLGFARAEKDSPILSTLTSRFGLVFSIFGATVNDEKQFVALELDGDQEKIDQEGPKEEGCAKGSINVSKYSPIPNSVRAYISLTYRLPHLATVHYDIDH